MSKKLSTSGALTASKKKELNSKKSSTNGALTISKINELKQSINDRNDDVSRILLASKDTLEKRKKIEAAFRECKEAFLEVSTVLVNILKDGALSSCGIAEVVKKAVTDAFKGSGDSLESSHLMHCL